MTVVRKCPFSKQGCYVIVSVTEALDAASTREHYRKARHTERDMYGEREYGPAGSRMERVPISIVVAAGVAARAKVPFVQARAFSNSVGKRRVWHKRAREQHRSAIYVYIYRDIERGREICVV